MNEKFAPELLESKADLVECMLDQIKEMASLELFGVYFLLTEVNVWEGSISLGLL